MLQFELVAQHLGFDRAVTGLASVGAARTEAEAGGEHHPAIEGNVLFGVFKLVGDGGAFI